MLELICNLTWLALGVTFALRFVTQPQTRSSVAVRAVAVFCLLLVLFPVVSLSDDLSAPEAALCDVVSHAGDQTGGTTAVDHTTSVAVALAHSATTIHLQFLHFAEAAQHHRKLAETHLLASDALRAPPAAL